MSKADRRSGHRLVCGSTTQNTGPSSVTETGARGRPWALVQAKPPAAPPLLARPAPGLVEGLACGATSREG